MPGKKSREELLREAERKRYVEAFKPENPKDLNLILGENADPETGISTHKFLSIPKDHLYRNTLAVGCPMTGKTSGFLSQILKQIVAHAPDERKKQIGGLLFDSKGKLSEQLKTYLAQSNRLDDLVEIKLEGEWIVNPIGNTMAGTSISNTLAPLMSPGHEPNPFWSSQFLTLIESMVDGLKAAFDYSNLSNICTFAADNKNGDRLIKYIDHVIGKTKQGHALVYRNIMPNTDSPWEKKAGVRTAVTLQTNTRVSPRTREEEATCYLRDWDDLTRKDPELKKYGAYAKSKYMYEAGLQKDHQAIPALDEHYKVWRKAFLNPNAEDKINLLEKVLKQFGIRKKEMVAPNPFPKDCKNDDFSHDFYPYRVNKLYFYKIPMTPLVKQVLLDLKIHYLHVDKERVDETSAFRDWYLNSWGLFDKAMKDRLIGYAQQVLGVFGESEVREAFGLQMVTYYDHHLNPEKNSTKILPAVDWLISEGKWVSVNLPQKNHYFEIIGSLLKRQFQGEALLRSSKLKREASPELNYEREFCFMIDDYEMLASYGNWLDCDNNFFQVTRASKVFGVLATSSFWNFRQILPQKNKGEHLSRLLTSFRNKVVLKLTDYYSSDYIAKMAHGCRFFKEENPAYRITEQHSPWFELSEKLGKQDFFQGTLFRWENGETKIDQIFLKPDWRPFNEGFHWQIANNKI